MTPSGYSTKFLFEFDSLNGTYYRIRIQKRNYSGNVITRALGQAPVLKRESGDNGVYGTSLEIYAECTTDGEFAELYTSSATEFYVTLGRVVSNTETIIWSGFVSPELYAEPDIAPPYDVQIIATDGLGELKRYDYVAQGRKPIYAYLQYLLSNTGHIILSTDYLICNALHPTDPAITAANVLGMVYINMDHLAGKTCYDVLVDMLTSFHFTITQLQNKWLMIRENDISLSSGNMSCIDGIGSLVSIPTEQFGSMASYQWWPVNQLEKEIVPAKNQVTIVQPYNFRPSMLDNYDFDELTAWTNSNAELVSGVGVKLKPVHTTETYAGYIRQAISVENNDYGFNLALKIAAKSKRNGKISSKPVEVEVRIKIVIGSTTYYLTREDDNSLIWKNEDNAIILSLEPKAAISSRDDLDSQTISNFQLPNDGTLTVEVKNPISSRYNNTIYIGEVCFAQAEINGYKDVLNLTNNAREELEEVEITLGDAPVDEPNLIKSIYNVLTYVQTPTKKWVSDKITPAAEFIKVIAQDYALSCALPRLRLSGKLNVPQNGIIAPIFRDSAASPIIYIPEEWSWDLMNDEVDFKLISAPAASLTITSEYVSELTNAEYQNTATGGNSSTSRSSGSSGGGGTPVVASFWSKYNDTEAQTQYEGIEANYPICVAGKIYSALTSGRQKMFEMVNIGTEQAPVYAIHTPLALYSDQDISVGIPGGGGGGGATTLLAVWITLTNNPQMVEPASYDNIAINKAHLAAIWEILSTYDNSHQIAPKFIKAFATSDAGKVLKINAAGTDIEWGEGGGGGAGSVTSVDTGTGLTGGPITSSGTIAIASAYLTKINNGQTAYGWGNHAEAGYLTQHQSLAGYATQSWVQGQGYLTQHQSLAGYATQTWVGQQGFITSSALDGYATEAWVQDQDYLTTSSAASTYLPLSGGTITGDLTVSGYVHSGTDVSCTSDIRLKRDFADLPNALDVVKGLRLFSHYWVDDRDGKTIGLSAQDLLKTPFECLVHEDENGYLSVSYQKLSVVALKAVQELEDKIDNLEKQIAALRELIKNSR